MPEKGQNSFSIRGICVPQDYHRISMSFLMLQTGTYALKLLIIGITSSALPTHFREHSRKRNPASSQSYRRFHVSAASSPSETRSNPNIWAIALQQSDIPFMQQLFQELVSSRGDNQRGTGASDVEKNRCRFDRRNCARRGSPGQCGNSLRRRMVGRSFPPLQLLSAPLQ